MQRWTFPNFRLSTGTTNTNSHPKSIHPKPTHHTQVEAQTHPRNNSQAYNPSPKHTAHERALRSPITKQKAQNEQLRKRIATLESKSAYLVRLKELEKEVEQLKKEGRELVRREEEVKRFVERGEKEVEGAVREDGWDGGGDGWDGGGGGDDGDEDGAIPRDRTSDEGTSSKGSVRRGVEDSEEELEGRTSQFKREDDSLDGDKDEDKREVKQEVEVEVKDPMDKVFEELELLSGAEAWRWANSRLTVDI